MNRYMILIILCLAVAVLTFTDISAKTQLDWKLGVQTFTFRKFTFFETIDKLSAMGIKYVEAWAGQDIGGGLEGKTRFDMDTTTRKKVKAKLASKGVKWISYFGRINGKNEEKTTELFEFAKDMGIQFITTEPLHEDLDLLEKLAKKYKIKVSIHNHAWPTAYHDPDVLLEALKGKSWIGACPDNGHWERSALDSVENMKKLKGRIFSLHLKDIERKVTRKEIEEIDKQKVKPGKKKKGAPPVGCVPYGTGVVDVKGVLDELARQGFKGYITIEYESNPENPDADVKKCVDYFNNYLKKYNSADLITADKKKGGSSRLLYKLKDLNLTSDQKKKIIKSKEGKAKAEMDAKWRALKDKKGPEVNKLRGERKKVQTAFDRMMEGILSADQIKKLKEMKSK